MLSKYSQVACICTSYRIDCVFGVGFGLNFDRESCRSWDQKPSRTSNAAAGGEIQHVVRWRPFDKVLKKYV